MNQHITVSSDSAQGAPSNSGSRRPRFFKRTYVLILIGLIIIVVAVLLVLAHQRRGGEAGRLTRELSPYIQLPSETPSIATVSDKSKLSGQVFFQQAQNGDKLIIYSKAKEVVLYRPSIHKVVDIAPISS